MILDDCVDPISHLVDYRFVPVHSQMGVRPMVRVNRPLQGQAPTTVTVPRFTVRQPVQSVQSHHQMQRYVQHNTVMRQPQQVSIFFALIYFTIRISGTLHVCACASEWSTEAVYGTTDVHSSTGTVYG